MLPPERRLPGVRRFIDEKLYFVVHAPRQAGKTTCFSTLARNLTAEGRHAALLTSCEVGQSLRPDVESNVAAILAVLRRNAEIDLPPELRPPPADDSVPAKARLLDLLTRWAQSSPLPVVLFLDEIDALLDDTLLTVLRQLRSGYEARPEAFPQSVTLIGLRDVRDYRPELRPDGESMGTASPFNIKVRSLTLADFTAEEVAELYAQHTEETGQVFTPEALARVWELTRGQPWLVNALADQIVREEAPDPEQPVDVSHVERAKEALILRRDTHLDSLASRLREPRVRKVIEPLLTGGLLPDDVTEDDLDFVRDLGLVTLGVRGLEVANPIYREVVPRLLTQVLEQNFAPPRPSYVDSEGRLEFDALLEDFRAFWLENAESFLELAPYSEAAAQLVFMAFLQKIVNGGGFVDREYAIGRGRIDLCVRWPRPDGVVERYALELKVWRDGQGDPLGRGLEPLSSYLERLGLESGWLLRFDARSNAPPLPERLAREEHKHEGRQIVVHRL